MTIQAISIMGTEPKFLESDFKMGTESAVWKQNLKWGQSQSFELGLFLWTWG